jgi:hypothetical protein
MDVNKNPGIGKVKDLKKSFMYAVSDLRVFIDDLLGEVDQIFAELHRDTIVSQTIEDPNGRVVSSWVTIG